MKRLFIIVLILTLILFVAVSGVVYARNTCEELVSMTEEAKRLSDAEDAAALALPGRKNVRLFRRQTFDFKLICTAR